MINEYEKYFITQDKTRDGHDIEFRMIEDEGGDIFWGYGHREGPEFVEEVNRWLIHVNAATVPDDLFALNTRVEHLYVTPVNPEFERFRRVEADSGDAVVVPVTRLMI